MNYLIYQIYYNEQTRSQILPNFIPLDNSRNPRPDWFEFWVILEFLNKNTLQENTLYGFLSPKFYSKTGFNSEFVIETISKAPPDTDVILLSPAWDQICYFKNPWEQGEAWHPGITEISLLTHSKCGINIDINSLVTDLSNCVYSNYFLANKKFWNKWHELATNFFHFMESPEAFDIACNITTSYGSIANQYPMKTFIQERFATLLLSTNEYKTIYPKNYWINPMFDRIFPNSFDKDLLITCNTLKNNFNITKELIYYESYMKIRERINYQSPL